MGSGRKGNPRQRMSGWRNGPWLAAVLGIAVVQAVVAWQYQGPRPQPASLGPDQFSAARALAVLQDILGDQQPHPTGSVANEQVRQRLVRHLERLELDIQLQAAVVHDQELVNVLARLGPDDGSHRPLVLATHYDSVPDGPGAADAGACVAALVETARAMQHRFYGLPAEWLGRLQLRLHRRRPSLSHGRGPHRASRFAAVWLGWSLAAIVLAAWLPGLSYLFILPVLMAAVVGWSRGLDEWSASFAAIGTSLLIVPPLYLVPIALGPHWAVTQCVLFSAALTPLYATLPAEWRQTPVMREPSDERSERQEI